MVRILGSTKRRTSPFRHGEFNSPYPDNLGLERRYRLHDRPGHNGIRHCSHDNLQLGRHPGPPFIGPTLGPGFWSGEDLHNPSEMERNGRNRQRRNEMQMMGPLHHGGRVVVQPVGRYRLPGGGRRSAFPAAFVGENGELADGMFFPGAVMPENRPHAFAGRLPPHTRHPHARGRGRRLPYDEDDWVFSDYSSSGEESDEDEDYLVAPRRPSYTRLRPASGRVAFEDGDVGFEDYPRRGIMRGRAHGSRFGGRSGRRRMYSRPRDPFEAREESDWERESDYHNRHH